MVASAQGFSSHDMHCIMPWPCTPCLLLLLMGKKSQGEMVEGDLLGSHTQTIIFPVSLFSRLKLDQTYAYEQSFDTVKYSMTFTLPVLY